MSGMVVLMTLIGGVGTLVGPVVGAIIVVSMENKIGEFGRMLANATGLEWFQSLGESVTIVIGVVFVICVMAFRKGDRKSTRLNSSHVAISYAVFCLKKT